MKLTAAIQFRGDKRAFVDAWNAREANKIALGIIRVEHGSEDYHRLKQLFGEYLGIHSMSLFERIEAEYDESELGRAEMLEFRVNRAAGSGGNEHSRAYADRILCEGCGRREQVQIASLTLAMEDFFDTDLEDGENLADFHITGNAELIVSEAARTLLSTHLGETISFQVVQWTSPDGQNPTYFQAVPTATIGYATSGSPVERDTPCAKCGLPTQVLFSVLPGILGSEFWFLRESCTGHGLFRTEERYGRVPNLRPLYFIDQALYESLKKCNITGYWVQPAHLVG